MSTPYLGWPLPTLSDTTPVVGDVFEWLLSADDCLFPRFSTFTERNNRYPTPAIGSVCYVDESGETYRFSTQGEWISLLPRRFFGTSNITLADTSPVTYTTFTLEALSVYFISGQIQHSGISPSDDLKIYFTFSESVLEGWYGIPKPDDPTLGNGFYDVGSSIGTASTIGVQTIDGEIIDLLGCYIYTNDETDCTISFSKAADVSTDGTIHAYSTYFDVWKVDGFGGIYGYGS